MGTVARREELLLELSARLRSHNFWGPLLAEILCNRLDNKLHVAIFSEPFLSFLKAGQKTVDTRLSSVRCAPYGHVSSGDLVLVKENSGPITAVTRVSDAEYFATAHHSLDAIRADYGTRILAGDDFWRSKQYARFASVIHVEQTTEFAPIEFAKTDRRGWVALDDDQLEFAF